MVFQRFKWQQSMLLLRNNVVFNITLWILKFFYWNNVSFKIQIVGTQVSSWKKIHGRYLWLPIWGHSKTMLTNFCPILTTYLPNVDVRWHLNYYLPNVNVDIWNIIPPPNMYLILPRRLCRRVLLCLKYWVWPDKNCYKKEITIRLRKKVDQTQDSLTF